MTAALALFVIGSEATAREMASASKMMSASQKTTTRKKTTARKKATGIKVVDLRTERMVSPMSIGTTTPRLGWRITADKNDVRQRRYHIIVASSKDNAMQGIGDLWDTTADSDQSQWVEYAGKPVRSNTTCYWRVKVETTQGDSEWSDVAMWNVGLISESDWSGQWIGFDAAKPWDKEELHSKLSSRYLRREFSLDKPVRKATLYISGLGMYEAFINGKKVGEQVLAPAPTDYRKTVVYNAFDVTDMMQSENAIAVALGNGRYYTMQQKKKPYKITNFGYPKLRANIIIEFADGTKKTISTDTKWKLNADGAIRSNNEYDGEIYDARKEFKGWTTAGYDDSKWENAERTAIPTGTLRGAMSPNMKVMKQMPAQTITMHGDTAIIDLGQNIAGWLKMRVENTASGDSIKIRFAETLTPDGRLYRENLRHALTTDCYVADGTEKGKWWNPTFVYHGFRYAEITGLKSPKKEDFIGEVVSDEMEKTGTFTCSDTILNKVYHNAEWGILANYKGMPVDCPQRDERLGWLGDRATGCYSESLVFNNNLFYNKWLLDIEESMSPEGAISDVSPRYWTLWRPNVTWPSAYFYAADMVYQRFGNDYSIRNRYDSMRKYILFVKNKFYDNGIVTSDTYGDWCMPPEKKELIHSQDPARRTDGRILSTTVYYDLLRLMEKFARHNGRMADVAEYEAMRAQIREAYNKTFFDKTKGCYGNNTVTANILSLQLGLVPDAYRQQVIDNIVAVTNGPMFNGHISTGVLGVQHLMRGLTRNGHGDLALKIATNDTYPSWGYMVKHGATTFWELWNGDTADPDMNSGNHVMLIGDFVVWMYEDLAGIRNDVEEDSYGYKKILMQPAFIDGLDHAAATYASPYGPIASNWTRTGDNLTWNITVPANATAKVVVPAKFHIAPKEGNGVRTVSSDTVIELGSGDYKFVSAK